MTDQNMISPDERDAELIAVLFAISQVSGRMARNLELIADQRKARKGELLVLRGQQAAATASKGMDTQQATSTERNRCCPDTTQREPESNKRQYQHRRTDEQRSPTEQGAAASTRRANGTPPPNLAPGKRIEFFLFTA